MLAQGLALLSCRYSKVGSCVASQSDASRAGGDPPSLPSRRSRVAFRIRCVLWTDEQAHSTASRHTAHSPGTATLILWWSGAHRQEAPPGWRPATKLTYNVLAREVLDLRALAAGRRRKYEHLPSKQAVAGSSRVSRSKLRFTSACGFHLLTRCVALRRLSQHSHHPARR